MSESKRERRANNCPYKTNFPHFFASKLRDFNFYRNTNSVVPHKVSLQQSIKKKEKRGKESLIDTSLELKKVKKHLIGGKEEKRGFQRRVSRKVKKNKQKLFSTLRFYLSISVFDNYFLIKLVYLLLIRLEINLN